MAAAGFLPTAHHGHPSSESQESANNCLGDSSFAKMALGCAHKDGKCPLIPGEGLPLRTCLPDIILSLNKRLPRVTRSSS